MSLRLRAVLMTGIALLVLWAATAAWMMQSLQSNLDRTLDGRLTMSARMVAGLLERSALDPASSHRNFDEAIRVHGHEGIACEVRALHGEVLAQSAHSPTFANSPPGLSTQDVQGTLWRVYVLRAEGYQITTADQISQRKTLAHDMLRAAGVPFGIAFLGGLAALWIGIGRGLSPLKQLCQQLRQKKVDDTTPIDVQRAPKELRAVLNAMNALLARLAQALSSQRAFTDAAAHELRTPLTIIDTHLQIIRLSDNDAEAQASLASAEEGVRRLCKTLNQMMALAHAEAPFNPNDACESIHAVLGDVLDSLQNTDLARIVLTTQGPDSHGQIPRSMLQTAIRNLIDNALHYSPQNSPVDVTLQINPADQQLLIQVADRGPGLSPVQATQATQRFWRADSTRQQKAGSGLGLSIVQAIADRFNGHFQLQARQGGGLIAELTLPLS